MQLAASQDFMRTDHGYSPTTRVYARFDLFAMWKDGYLHPDSFLDLATSLKWSTSFPPEIWNVKMAKEKIHASTVQRASILCNEIYIGVRHLWWVKYCYIVDEGNRKRSRQRVGVDEGNRKVWYTPR